MGARVRAVFSKKETMVFISHLDLVRLFQRAVRRAGLPVSMTQGFSPHQRISITKALKLGLESDSLEAVFALDAAVPADDFKIRMNAELPRGIAINEVTIL